MSFKPFFFTLTLGLLLAPGLVPAAPSKADETSTFDYAPTLYMQQQWAGAYGRFAALADRGNKEAAHIALFMVRHGSQLYKTGWSATPMQIGRWVRLTRSDMGMFVADGAD